MSRKAAAVGKGEAAERYRISVICEAPGWRRAFPRPVTRLRAAALTALKAVAEEQGGNLGAGELCLVLADDGLQQNLNREWRGRDRPTNVLSFPDGTALPDGGKLFGDVVLALETCRREADEQGKPLADHAAHLVVHGVLHLLGYDHEEEAEAARMEALEVRLLGGLGIADPYAESGEAAA